MKGLSTTLPAQPAASLPLPYQPLRFQKPPPYPTPLLDLIHPPYIRLNYNPVYSTLL